MCPHNGAKSVLAESYFKQRADEMGLDIDTLTAGTDPYETVVPTVVERLKLDGFDVSSHQPRNFTQDDVDRASLIISMECDIEAALSEGKQIEYWNDVPLVSEDIEKAYAVIKSNVDALLERLQ
jgi:protein-tyrosine-phosphatase